MKFSSLVKIGFGFCIGYAAGTLNFPWTMEKLLDAVGWVEDLDDQASELIGTDNDKVKTSDKTNKGRKERINIARVLKESGSSNVEIAKRLGVSESTVRGYLK